LGTTKDEKTGFVPFGFGQFWADYRITECVRGISKIEIITVSDTLILEDKTEMFNYFKKRRRGIFKRMIKIEIK